VQESLSKSKLKKTRVNKETRPVTQAALHFGQTFVTERGEMRASFDPILLGERRHMVIHGANVKGHWKTLDRGLGGRGGALVGDFDGVEEKASRRARRGGKVLPGAKKSQVVFQEAGFLGRYENHLGKEGGEVLTGLSLYVLENGRVGRKPKNARGKGGKE